MWRLVVGPYDVRTKGNGLERSKQESRRASGQHERYHGLSVFQKLVRAITAQPKKSAAEYHRLVQGNVEK